LWDKKERTIVSNESADILRMFNSAFDDLGAKGGDYHPKELRAEIDEVNSRIYAHLNNGVRLVAYPSLWSYTRELYQHSDIQPTVNFQHIKGHYYGSHRWLNPSGIIPTGPDIDFDAPSNRYGPDGER
jgi:glutathionyl-hydroquinone reductase